ncbi:MAG TPA: mercuric reductase [Longimicrobium sp.]|jgi:pyruvate/2-oxoglutarate dehydrogenase complex dihydrolipoamide dehydrogenase (E3) component|uniref:mercuric reductase n=1 Tax=Longimicrobium sp. TaxID=2029185 RepID=UPI002EDB94C7
MAHDPTSFPAVQPLEAHNRRLLENVHPPAWSNPQPKDRYHLVVVGAGTAGLVTAAIGAALGARVALIERALMGGDCLNVGCVPSKAILAAARAWHTARTAAERFSGPAAGGDGDFGAMMERMRRIRADLSPVDSAARFRDEVGADVFLGEARFVDEDAVEVDGQRLRFHRAVIATGGRAAVPPVEGLADAGYLTNETIFSLTERPEHLAVIGGGPIGCELAQAFVRFGARVTLIENGPRILPHDDADAAEIVAAALRRDGVRVLTDARVDSVAAAGAGKTVRVTRGGETTEIIASHLLVAAGRAPNVEGLGLDEAGVAFSEKGVEVDERMRTANPRIFAIGDVASRYKFTHAADAQARMVVRNALFYGRGNAEELVMPWCTYTSPELAHVGITPDQVAEAGDEVETITVPLEEVDRARLEGETEGFVRVHLKAGSDTLLGATIVAGHAGDLISQVTQAMTAGVGLGRLGDTIYPYPTTAEALRKAADRWRRGKLTPTARRAFDLFFRALR